VPEGEVNNGRPKRLKALITTWLPLCRHRPRYVITLPEGVHEVIERLKRQIDATEEKLAGFEADIDAAREEFAPIIQRLKEIEEEER